MRKSGLVKIFSASLLCVCAAFSSFAGFWDWTQPYKGPKRDIVNLIITGNYRDTLLLAQVAQYHSKQPFILLPAKGQKQIFFWPARQETAMEIPEKDFSRFISFLNPERIIIIGSTNVVSEKYLNMIPRDQTVVVVYNQDWAKVAQSLDAFMREPNISSDFNRLKEQLDNGALYAPTKDKKSVEPVTLAPATEAPAPAKALAPATAKPAENTTVKIVTFEGANKKADAAASNQENMPKDAPVLIDANKK